MKPEIEKAAKALYKANKDDALIPLDAWLAYADNICTQVDDVEITALEDAAENYQGEFKNWTDMAESMIENWGILDSAPEPIRSYFDYEKFGNDLRLGGEYWENEGHYFLSR